jgi:hypothetical protein
VNDEEQVATSLSKAGKAIFALDISPFNDGQLAVSGYATDAANNKSGTSEPLLFTKDTHAPEASREEVVFLVSPVTEASRVAVYVPLSDHVRLAVSQKNETLPSTNGQWTDLPVFSDPITISFADEAGNTKLLPNIDIQPQFSQPSLANDDSWRLPAQFSAWGRSFTISALVVVLILLMLAVFIRVRIQHPALITHATFVILLAAVLLVV